MIGEFGFLILGLPAQKSLILKVLRSSTATLVLFNCQYLIADHLESCVQFWAPQYKERRAVKDNENDDGVGESVIHGEAESTGTVEHQEKAQHRSHQTQGGFKGVKR